MSPPDVFRPRLDHLIDLEHPLAVLAIRLLWASIEAAVARKLVHQAKPAKRQPGVALSGPFEVEFGGSISPAGRTYVLVELMISLLYLKSNIILSDEEFVERWAGNENWQIINGREYYEPRLPCDATQIGRFRGFIGEDGIEQLLKATIGCSADIMAIKPAELERVIVDSTVQSKAIAHAVDRRLQAIARHKVFSAAKRAGIALEPIYSQEGRPLRRKAGSYAHAKQFKRLRQTVKCQRTILELVMREVRRKHDADKAAVAAGGAPAHAPQSPRALSDLATLMERPERIRSQQRNTKNKMYALHAPEVECISKGKSRKPYEFGVKVSLVVTYKQGLMVGARSLTGNPYDGHVLSAQLEQTANLLQDTGRGLKQVIVDLGYRGVGADNLSVQIIHRGKYKWLSDHEKRLLKRRRAIEAQIRHTRADHRMDCCWLHGVVGDALHALSCAAGNNIRWLLRDIARLGLGGLFCVLSFVIWYAVAKPQTMLVDQRVRRAASRPRHGALPRSDSSSLTIAG